MRMKKTVAVVLLVLGLVVLFNKTWWYVDIVDGEPFDARHLRRRTNKESLNQLIKLRNEFSKQQSPNQLPTQTGHLADGQVFAERGDDTWCPKVFKYQLPEEWLNVRVLADRNQADPTQPNPFGGALWKGVLGFHGTKHKSAPPIFEHLLDAYGDLCLVEDPDDADIFFIPWYREYYCGIRRCDWYTKELPEEKSLFPYIQNYTIATYGKNYFTRNNGRDHFMLIPSEAATALVPKPLKFFLGNYKNLTTFSAGYGSTFGNPFASLARFEAGMSEKDLPWRYEYDENIRRTGRRLLFMAFGTPYGIRHTMMEQCRNAGHDTCLNVEEVARSVIFPKSETVKELGEEAAEELRLIAFRKVVQGMRTSTFCINIGGDFCSRRGFIDSALLGCISVTFSHCPLEYYNSYIDMNKLVVLVSRQYAGNIIEYLRAIPEFEIRQRQLYIAQHAHKLQYSKIANQSELRSLPPHMQAMVKGDAFFRTLWLVAEVLERTRTCEAFGGLYQSRYAVCCEHPNGETLRQRLNETDPSCQPLHIVAGGYTSSCAARGGSPPCYFDNPQLTDQVMPYDRLWDPLEPHDYLRYPVPHILPPIMPNFTTDTTW